jgi:hypothetical protein
VGIVKVIGAGRVSGQVSMADLLSRVMLSVAKLVTELIPATETYIEKKLYNQLDIKEEG